MHKPYIVLRNELLATKQIAPETAKLVEDFAMALLGKLAAAEKKHGYNTHWMKSSQQWLYDDFIKHIAKGDPVDVAAYCAFFWSRGFATTPPQEK